MKKYTNPYIDVLVFDEEDDILAASTGYTASKDVAAQMEKVSGGNMSIGVVRLEDIQIK